MTMNIKQRMAAASVAAAFAIGLMAAPTAAMASEDGRRNTAIGLGVAAAGLLLTQRNKVPGIIAGVAAVAAASRIGHDRNRWDRRYGYNDNYRDRDDRYGGYDRYDNRNNSWDNRYDNRWDNRNDNRYNDRYYHQSNSWSNSRYDDCDDHDRRHRR